MLVNNIVDILILLNLICFEVTPNLICPTTDNPLRKLWTTSRQGESDRTRRLFYPRFGCRAPYQQRQSHLVQAMRSPNQSFVRTARRDSAFRRRMHTQTQQCVHTEMYVNIQL